MNEWPAANTRGFYVKIFDMFFSIGVLSAFCYYFWTEMQKNKDNNQFGIANKGEFEFKKAEDIKERLDDVKGIDEIRTEIQ